MTIIVLVIVAFALGLASALTRTPPPSVMRLVIAGMMMTAALLVLISAWREPAFDKAARVRHSILAAAWVLIGLTPLLAGAVRLSLSLIAAATLVTLFVLQRRSRSAQTQ